jgi:hypothetical protein
MKSKRLKQIESARGALTTLMLVQDKLEGRDEAFLSGKETVAVEEGYKALRSLQQHELRKVGQRYRIVSSHQWAKWNADEREVYNIIMKTCLPLQDVLGPSDLRYHIPHKHWRTVLHNIAFMAAVEMRARRKQDKEK